VLFGKAVLAALMSGRNLLLFKRKQYGFFGFSKRSPFPKRIAVTEHSVEKIRRQIMLSGDGDRSLNRLQVFCTVERREDGH
jgi:hypothetical protein